MGVFIDFKMNLSIDTILVPRGAEYKAVCRGLKQANWQETTVVPIPIGVNNIVEYLENQSFWQASPQRVVMMGLCGSLSVGKNIGDPVLYQACYYPGRNVLFTDKSFTDAIYQKLDSQVAFVTGLTSDIPICKAQDKLTMAQTSPTSVVDMEGFGYLKELWRRDIAVAMLRVVSDDFIYDLPDLSRAIDDDGNLRYLPLASAMLKQPKAAIRLIKGSLIGLKVLEQITIKLFSNL